MSPVRQQVAEHLKAFRAHSDATALAQASNIVESMVEPMVEPTKDSGAPAGAGEKSFRAEKLALELEILNQIDGKRIQHFDFADVPSMSVSPPPETGLPAGVDPADIRDPAARARYAHAIKENQQKAAQYALQKRLAKLDRRVTAQTERHIADAYSMTPADLTELGDLFSKHVASERRKAALKRFAQTHHAH